MADAAYFRARAERYFRIARAKSDRDLAARLEAMGREFLARAEGVSSDAAMPEHIQMADAGPETSQRPLRPSSPPVAVITHQ